MKLDARPSRHSPAAPTRDEWLHAIAAFTCGITAISGDFVDPQARGSFFRIDIFTVSHILNADPTEPHGFTRVNGRFIPEVASPAVVIPGEVFHQPTQQTFETDIIRSWCETALIHSALR